MKILSKIFICWKSPLNIWGLREHDFKGACYHTYYMQCIRFFVMYTSCKFFFRVLNENCNYLIAKCKYLSYWKVFSFISFICDTEWLGENDQVPPNRKLSPGNFYPTRLTLQTCPLLLYRARLANLMLLQSMLKRGWHSLAGRVDFR